MSLGTNIQIAGLNKAEVLASLYNNAGRSYNNDLVRKMSVGEAQNILKTNLTINKIWGKQLMVDFRTDRMINTFYYDRIQGLNQGKFAISKLKNAKLLQPSAAAVGLMSERPMVVNTKQLNQSLSFIPNASTPTSTSANFMNQQSMNVIITSNNRPEVNVNNIVNVATMPQKVSSPPKKRSIINTGRKNLQVEKAKRKLRERKLLDNVDSIFAEVDDIDGDDGDDGEFDDDDGEFYEHEAILDSATGEERTPDETLFTQRPRKSAVRNHPSKTTK